MNGSAPPLLHMPLWRKYGKRHIVTNCQFKKCVYDKSYHTLMYNLMRQKYNSETLTVVQQGTDFAAVCKAQPPNSPPLHRILTQQNLVPNCHIYLQHINLNNTLCQASRLSK
jgi:hypothetical protein